MVRVLGNQAGLVLSGSVAVLDYWCFPFLLLPGQIQVNDCAQYPFYILNTGKFNFSFTWEFHNTKALQQYLAISPNSGMVEPGERMESVLSFRPLKTCTLKDVELRLQVIKGFVAFCLGWLSQEAFKALQVLLVKNCSDSSGKQSLVVMKLRICDGSHS